MKSLAGYIFGIFVLLLAAKFGELFAENILELRRLEALEAGVRAEVQGLENRNIELAAEARALDDDAFYVELTIRRRLRWMRPDETPGEYYRPGTRTSGETLLAAAPEPARRATERPLNLAASHPILARLDARRANH